MNIYRLKLLVLLIGYPELEKNRHFCEMGYDEFYIQSSEGLLHSTYLVPVLGI